MSSTSFPSTEEDKKTSVMEKANPSQEAIHNEQLAKSLKEMLKKSVNELKTTYRTDKKRKALEGNDEISSEKVFSSIQRHEDVDLLVQDHQKKGRKVKNEVIDEKVVSFSLPRNFDMSSASIEDINKVQERLGTWRIQRRKRDTGMIDMFYCHLSSRQTFRSIPEAVGFIMYDSHPRFSKQTPKKDKVGSKTLIESPLDEPRKKVENPQGLDHVEVVKVLGEKENEEYNNFSDTFGLIDCFPVMTMKGGCDHERMMVADNATEKLLMDMMNDYSRVLNHVEVAKVVEEEENEGYKNFSSDTFDLTEYFSKIDHERMVVMDNATEKLLVDMMDDYSRVLNHVEVAKVVEEKENEGFNNVVEVEVHQEVMQKGRGRKYKALMKQSEFESVQKELNNVEEQRYGDQFYPQFNNLSMPWEENYNIFSKMIYTHNFDISSYLPPLNFLFDNNNPKK